MESTNICMLVHQNYFRDGRVRRYAETLAAIGYKVDILCIRETDMMGGKPGEGITIYTIPMLRNDGGRWYYFFEYGMAFICYAVWMLFLYFRHRYAVIHVHNMPDFFIFTAFIPKLLGAQLLLDIHDPMPEFYMSKFMKSSSNPMVWVLKLQEKLSARFADEIITANINFKGNLVARGIPSEKINVVHNVPDFRIFDRTRFSGESIKKGDRFTIIFPGTIAYRYGLDLAIRALPLLLPRIPNIYLLIIGQRDKYSWELENLADQLGVSSHVEILPTIPVEEIPSHVISADIGIYPAYRDVHMDIAIPSKVLEFVILGIPIVASRLTVLKQLFSEKAILFFEPGNVEQFADCILAIHHYPSIGKDMVNQADAEFAQKYDFFKEQESYINVINRLLKPRDTYGQASRGIE